MEQEIKELLKATARIEENTRHIQKAVDQHGSRISVLEVWKNKIVGVVGFVSAAASAYITHIFKGNGHG